MVDIQSATAEIRRGIKKEDRRKKPQGKNIMPPPYYRAAITRATPCVESMVDIQSAAAEIRRGMKKDR